jgi:hypothetical protein
MSKGGSGGGKGGGGKGGGGVTGAVSIIFISCP